MACAAVPRGHVLNGGRQGHFGLIAEPLTRFLDGLPWVRARGASRVSVSGELATSRPQPGRTRSGEYLARL